MFRIVMDVLTGGSFSEATAAVTSRATQAVNMAVDTGYKVVDTAREVSKTVAKTVSPKKNKVSTVLTSAREKQAVRREGILEEREKEANNKKTMLQAEVHYLVLQLNKDIAKLSASTFLFMSRSKLGGKLAKKAALEDLLSPSISTLSDLQKKADVYLSDRAVIAGWFSHRTRDVLQRVVAEDNPLKQEGVSLRRG